MTDKMRKTLEDSGLIYPIDARPVVCAKWKVISFMTVQCTNCKETFHELERDKYCPNCGAYMKSSGTANVPRHGRLIDADALAAKCDEPYWCVWLSDIESAPTIIEAN